jgi:hypothetical protein
MRTLSAQEAAVLQAPDGYSVHVRVWLWDGAAFQNVTALEDRDWLVSVDWDESINDGVAQATVQVRRRLEDLSLNPLVSNKMTGALALNRPFYIETATVPLGDAATAGDWREVFRGRIDELSLENDPISFTGRDLAGALVRAEIEVERGYGSDAGVPVETVLQSILTDNATGVTLYVPVATGAVFGRFKQKKGPVLSAIRELVLRIGWDVRYLWDSGTGAFRFTLIKPNRTASTSLWTFQPKDIKKVTRLSQSVHDVRNVVSLSYYNRSVLDASGKPTLSYVTATDAASIATYGRSVMRLAEDEDSPIDSAGEAQTMADAARDDLKDPLLEMGVTVWHRYDLQLGDMVTFPADEDHFSSAQTLAVVALSHRIDARGGSTTLQLRGKPVGANDEWLMRDGRVTRQPTASAPDAVSALTATGTSGGGVISFAPPAVPPLPVEYELHLSTSPGFAATSSTFRVRGNVSKFEPTGLTPGTTHYAKVVSIDKAGNRSVSSEASFTPRYVEVRSFQPKVAYGTNPPNADFEALSVSGAPPDMWAVEVGSWGADVLETTDSYSGGRGLRVLAGRTAAVVCGLMSVRGGVSYAARIAVRIAGTAVSDASVAIQFFNSAGAVLVGGPFHGLTGTNGAWVDYEVIGTAPADARYANAYVRAEASNAQDIYIDSMEFGRAVLSQMGWKLVGPFTSFLSGWANAPGFACGFRINSLGNLEFKGLAVAPTPAPAGYANMLILPEGYRPKERRAVRIASTGGTTFLDVDVDGRVRVQSVSAGAELPLDGVSLPL